MTAETDIHDLATEIMKQGERSKPGVVRMVQAQVVDLTPDLTTCSVSLQGGEGGTIDGVHWLRDSYVPVPGDTVFCLRNGPDLIVLGKTQGTPMSYNPCVSLTQLVPVNTTTGVRTAHSMDDPASMPDGDFAKLGGLLFPRKMGFWRFDFEVIFDTNTTGRREVGIRVNNTTTVVAGTVPPVSGTPTIMSCFLVYPFTTYDDYFVPETFQNSGGTLATNVRRLTPTWLRPPQ